MLAVLPACSLNLKLASSAYALEEPTRARSATAAIAHWEKASAAAFFVPLHSFSSILRLSVLVYQHTYVLIRSKEGSILIGTDQPIWAIVCHYVQGILYHRTLNYASLAAEIFDRPLRALRTASDRLSAVLRSAPVFVRYPKRDYQP